MPFKTFACAAVLCLPILASAGTLPQPGDLAILQATGNGAEYAACITLAPNLDLRAITATDNGWLSTSAFRSGEGYSTASPSTAAWDNVPLGTVIEFGPSLVDNDASDGFLGAPSSGIAFSTTGDQIFVFRGLSSAPTILCGLTSYRSVWQSDATNANTSANPANGGVFAAVGQVSSHYTDVYFSMPSPPTDVAALKVALADRANWTGNQSPDPRFADRSFTPISLTSSERDFMLLD